jgi:predicted transcriptional regulator
MSVNLSELDSFHQFAVRALAGRSEDLSLEELLKRWRAQQDREDTIASVRRGVNDAEAGRIRDMAEVDASIRAELGFPARQR